MPMANRLTRFWLKQRPIAKELSVGAVVTIVPVVLVLASTEGGVEIERVAETPHLIHKVAL